MLKKLLLFICLFSSLIAWSAEDHWIFSARGYKVSPETGQPLLPVLRTSSTNPMLVVNDQWYPYMLTHPTWSSTVFNIRSCKERVTLRYDDSKEHYMTNQDNWSLTIQYNITYVDFGLVSHTVPGQTLTISYDPVKGYLTKDKDIREFANGVEAQLFVTSMTYTEWNPSSGHGSGTPISGTPTSVLPSFLQDVYLDLEQITERYYYIPATGNTANVYQQTMTNNNLHIGWNYIQGAESYDIEWLFIDIPQNPIASSTATVDFSKATRINTVNQWCDIPLGFPRGRVAYRVRAVGVDPTVSAYNVTVYGPWDYVPSTGTTVATMPANNSTGYGYLYYDYNGLNSTIDWQYGISFAEDGKRKEVLNFFDGSLRKRQTITMLNTDQNAIIAEPRYDYQGRGALQILPSVTPSLGLQYYGLFNSTFDRKNFDVDSKVLSPDALPSSTGAGQYYSSSNPDLSGVNAYIPDAGGYAYTRTRYMNDGTHRIKSQTVPGSNYQTGSGHEVRYFYGTPTSQTELDRLFGNEVGFVSHYKKNLVVDANGQGSISYLDQEGRVVATALAGNNGGNLLTIDGPLPPPQTLTANLLGNNNLDGNGNMVSATTLLVTSPGVYSFSYSLSPANMIQCSVFANAVYDLELTIADDEGNTLYSNTATAITQVSPPTVFTYTFSNVGSYVVSKVLKPNAANLASLKTTFLANQTCVTMPALTPEPCSSDCNQSCVTSYFTGTFSGPDSVYVDDHGNTIPTTNNRTVAWPLLTNCRANLCYHLPVKKDPCDIIYKSMLDDMSPGGQYFDNKPSEYITTSVNGPQQLNPNWLTLNLSYPTQYRDGWLNTYATGGISLINTNCSTSFTNWTDVRNNWQSCFATALVTLHPEYCAYTYFCDHTSCGFSGMEPEDSLYNYDYQMEIGGVANGTSSNFMNPLLWTGGSSTTGGATNTSYDYANYFPSYISTSYTWKDPFYNTCFSNSTCSSSSISSSTYALTLLQKFIRRKDYSGADIQYGGNPSYYDIWYVLDDPDHIAGSTPSVINVDANIVNYFTDIQNAISGSSPYTMAYTKYQIFNSIYLGIRHLLQEQAYKNYYTTCTIAPTDSRYSNGFLKLNNPTSPAAAANGPISPDGFVIHYPPDPLTSSLNLCSITSIDYQLVMGTLPTTPAPLSQQTANEPSNTYDQTSCIVNNLLTFLSENAITYTPNSAAVNNLVANTMNGIAGMTTTVTARQVSTWLWQIVQTSPVTDSLTNVPSLFLCVSSEDSDPKVPTDYNTALNTECDTLNHRIALNNALTIYNRALNAQLQSFLANYLSTCMSGLSTREVFTTTYTLNEYEYTLYYYDQAGNLIKTVPPNGVAYLSSTTTPNLTDVLNYRNGVAGSTFSVPPHTFVTNYQYNSLQQLTSQITPDAGLTTFYYDSKGRLVVSQNAYQANGSHFTPTNPAYSYTVYDNLSRISEVGQLQSATPMTYLISRDQDMTTSFSAWMAAALPSKTEVTNTYYDQEIISLGQQNLRGRVATVQYTKNPASGPYDNAENYSYDIHGNVQFLIEENNDDQLPTILMNRKRTDYSYDLVSGNVNQVDYQNGQIDQFHQKYEYDADNRVIRAFSSRDGITWEKEAKYFYYKHGPLSRTEVGDKEVQANDMVYTAQGWIKGVNSATLQSTRDVGLDAEQYLPSTTTKNLNREFAKDGYGYTLAYNGNDYRSIGTFPVGSTFDATVSSTALSGASYDLFNGNIMRMVTALKDNNDNLLPAQVRAFRYDQLNRIKKSDAYADANVVANDDWGSSAANNSTFHEDFTYDFNGNITTANRNGNNTGATQVMDNLAYNYTSGTNQLSSVTDNPLTDGNYGGDIKSGQAAGNYGYNEIGELTSDAQEEIRQITWTVYGKVSTISRTTGSSKSELEFIYDAKGNRICKIEKPRAGGFLNNQANWKYTYYIRDAKGNVLATYDRWFTSSGGSNYTDHFKLHEHDIYGSSRVGVRNGVGSDEIDQSFTATLGAGAGAMFTAITYTIVPVSPPNTAYFRELGHKVYEHSNHLGNVMTTYTDKKIPIPTSPTPGTQVAYYEPEITSYTDYFAFGAEMPGRNYTSSTGYRYGFNGKEDDNEVKGNGNSLDFGARIFDSRLGKWLSLDPLQAKYANKTPFGFGSDDPVNRLDPDGEDDFHFYYYNLSVNINGKRVNVGTVRWYTVTKNSNKNTYTVHTLQRYENLHGDILSSFSELTKVKGVEAGKELLKFNVNASADYGPQLYATGTATTAISSNQQEVWDLEAKAKAQAKADEETKQAGQMLGLLLTVVSDGLFAEFQSGAVVDAGGAMAWEKRLEAFNQYSANWARGSLSETLEKFGISNEGVMSEDLVKTRFTNQKYEVIYDNEYNYYRILDKEKRQYVNIDGKVPSTGKLKGNDAKDYVNQQTHIKNETH